MGWLLNAAYAFAALLLLPAAAWRYLWRRKPTVGIWQKLTGRVSIARESTQTIWLHAVSVGEVNLLVHIHAQLQRRYPHVRTVVSTTTWTGYELASRRFGRERTFFFPWDFTWSVAESLRRVRPAFIVLAELEVWPNFLRETQRQRIPVAIVNGRLSEQSAHGYQRLKWLVAPAMRSLAWVGAQNAEYAKRFALLGVEPARISITGNLKFDQARTDRRNPATLKLAALVEWPADSCIWLAGSTQDPEERIVIQAFRSLISLHPKLRLIIAPRHPERCPEVIDELNRQGFRAIQRSHLVETTPLGSRDVLVIDTVGELGAWWGLSQIAFVGGSLGDRGGQNMIEPAAYGCAVSFGPNTKNFRDVVQLLLAHDASVVVHNAEEMTRFVRQCLVDERSRAALGRRAAELVRSQVGAGEATLQAIARLLPESERPENSKTPPQSSATNELAAARWPRAG